MTPRLADVLREVAAALHAEGVAFALVGGLAVSARTEPRFTRDVDLAVAVAGDREAEAVVGALAPHYVPVAILQHEALQRMASVRLGRSSEDRSAGVVVDLLFASSGVEAEVVETAEPLQVFADVTVPVARSGHLIALKLLAYDDDRPQDGIDLQALVAVADRDELAHAARLVDLIMSRGGNRGRDLAGRLHRLTSAGGLHP